MRSKPQNALPRGPWTDDATLLCERCGYVVEGLPTDGPCPECGYEIAMSLPRNRSGTPWQNHRGVGATMATGWWVVTQPRRTLDRMRIQPPRFGLLLSVAALPIGCAVGAALVLLFELERPLPGGGSTAWSPGSTIGAWMLALVLGIAVTPLIAAVLWGLTWIEARGLVIFGKQNKFRVPPDLAHTIVRHGAFCWLLCGVGALLELPLLLRLGMDSGLAFGPPGRVLYVLAFAGMVFVLLGFLAFEFFAWFGLRRCRFANRLRQDGVDQEALHTG